MADIGDAYKLLTPLLGTSVASTLFALALLASGQNSTITGTLAGQIVMEGFLDIRLKPWLRRLITRLIAIIPAVIVTALYGEKGVGKPAHPEPGHPEPAALLRGGAAGALHQSEGQDGGLREQARRGRAGLDRHRGHRRPQRVVVVDDISWMDELIDRTGRANKADGSD